MWVIECQDDRLQFGSAYPLFTCPSLRSLRCSTHWPLCRTTAFQSLHTVGFHLRLRLILSDHNCTYFGTQYTACKLATPRFRHHLTVIALRFTTHLLAKRWLGGIHTRWVTSIKFRQSTSFPRFDIYLDTISVWLGFLFESNTTPVMLGL